MFNTTLKNELLARTAEISEYKGLITALERSMAVVEFDLNGKVLRANDNFLKVLGYSSAQLAGKSHRDFCLPALTASPAYSQFWADLKAGKFVSGTFKRVNGNGKTIWLEASYNPVLDERGQVLKVISTDQGSLKDFEAFCKQTNNPLLSSAEEGGKFIFFVKKA